MSSDNYILIKKSLEIGAVGIAMYQLLDEVLFDNEWQAMIDQQIADLQAAIGDPTVINGLTGDVEIVAGTNVTIDVSGQQITINAAGGSGSPQGPDTSIQFNDSGSFSGDANLTYNGDQLRVTDTGTSPGTDSSYAFAVRAFNDSAITLGADTDANMIQGWNNKPLWLNKVGNNVGIGPGSSADEQLHVHGNTRVEGIVYTPLVRTQQSLEPDNNEEDVEQIGIQLSTGSVAYSNRIR